MSSAQTALVGLTTAIRQPWLTLRVRVRQWGRLPVRRGPTVLVANHQHEDESEIVVERAFLQGRFRPLFTASSRRMYEPGFFATRMPWLRFLRGVDAGPLFLTLGMLPLENELAARPLRSIARALHALHGDLPVAIVFRSDALAAIAPGARTLGELLAPARFAAGETRVRLAHVLEPYRGELVGALRASVAEDIRRITATVRAGATFFVTPEGFYSTSGTMRPLKGIVEHLVPIAQVWLAAIAFDPFRGRRLSMLYRVLEAPPGAQLATALAAARPVTTSALLARWIVSTGLPFERREAHDGVARLRDALPPQAFVDPELREDARACVDEALDALLHRGALAVEGTRCRIGPPRGDPRFPGVSDMLAYQSAFIAETLRALSAP